jgi:CBS domain-containing protein
MVVQLQTQGKPQMAEPDRLIQIAQQLSDGSAVQPVSVREFLSWFGAQRRGWAIVADIREALNEADLETEPDFESAYIDSPITLKARQTSTSEPAAAPATIELSATASTTASATANLSTGRLQADPTYRISKLAAANNPPISVSQDAKLEKAVTLMMTNGFSQLPVMTGERDVKGLVSWASIGSRLALGKTGTSVKDLMDANYQEIRADASLFQAIPIIVQHQYVLVRGPDNRIVGIVTSSDLSLQFQQLAEPFLLLGEIENHIRRLISARFSQPELAATRSPTDTNRTVEQAADMNFGEYIRLLENQDRWNKLGISIDRATFCEQLDRVRSIRNDVVHFDPDGILPEDLERIRDFATFLQRLHTLGVT